MSEHGHEQTVGPKSCTGNPSSEAAAAAVPPSEEHVNTGFMFARASHRSLQLVHRPQNRRTWAGRAKPAHPWGVVVTSGAMSAQVAHHKSSLSYAWGAHHACRGGFSCRNVAHEAV